MQFKHLLFAICAFQIVGLVACKKNQSDEHFIEDPSVIIPDLTTQKISTVAGFIMDEQNKPVAGAEIIAGNKKTNTDEYGYFKIPNVNLNAVAGFIQISKSGYFINYKTFTVTENKEQFLRAKLLQKINSGTFNAGIGGTVTTTDGAKIILPANSIVNATTGTAYSGIVQVAAKVLDPSASSDFQMAFPGDGRGLNAKGELKILKQYAAIAVELSDPAGNRLQIAENKKATIQIPIPGALQNSAPNQIALWRLDEKNGLWKEEGIMTKEGNTYTGLANHFSYWEGSNATNLVDFTVQIVNAALQPLVNVPVVITIASQPQNAGYGRFAFTDANGVVRGSVYANTAMNVDVLTTCANSAYTHSFTSGSSAVDLGTLTGNLGQSMVTITGKVVNCNNEPVTNGYVQTYDHGFYNRIYINNGNFSFTGLACTNTTADYVAVDLDANQQNQPNSVLLTSGINDWGTISSCGVSSMSTLSFTYDNITTNYSNPTNVIAGYYLDQGWTAIATLDHTNNGSPAFTFQFDGGSGIGNQHKISEMWFPQFPSGRGYTTNPVDVTITEYGNSGGFITGSFSGNFVDFVDNTIHSVSCNFRIKRYN